MAKIKVGISACLVGKKVRYDGSHHWDTYITTVLGRFFDWVPVCPEVEYGLTVPREPMRLEGDPECPHLVTVYTRIEHTEGMKRWAAERINELAEEDICGFVFKSGSPSSGLRNVKVYGPSGRYVKAGIGVFARVIVDNFRFLPLEEDIGLHDPESVEGFIRRVQVYHRWKSLQVERGELKEFHDKHRLLIMAHSPHHLHKLDELVNEPGLHIDEKLNLYFPILMEGLSLKATRRKHGKVLLSAFNRLKIFLNEAQAKDILLCIEGYRKKLYPLIVPRAVVAHYARIFGVNDLLTQVYFNVSAEGGVYES
ncbi:MAG: DUF523 and DUF1722 domain-containing protein [Syntrophales bacterium]|nr:DUF523 and DUF1722 domain-containing protein [Syntrophales bacterium]